MSALNQRLLVACAVAVAILGAAAWLYRPESRATDDTSMPAASVAGGTTGALAISAVGETPASMPVELPVHSDPPSKTPDHAATAKELSLALEPQREAWKRSRGVLSELELTRYRGMRDDELRRLAEAGDFAAMLELAKRMPNSQEGVELERQAEIRGSIKPALDSIRAAEEMMELPRRSTTELACSSLWNNILYLEMIGYYEVMTVQHIDPLLRARCETTVMTATMMYSSFHAAKLRLNHNNQVRARLGLPPLETQGMPGHAEWMAAQEQEIHERGVSENARRRAMFPNAFPSATPPPPTRRTDGNGG